MEYNINDILIEIDGVNISGSPGISNDNETNNVTQENSDENDSEGTSV